MRDALRQPREIACLRASIRRGGKGENVFYAVHLIRQYVGNNLDLVHPYLEASVAGVASLCFIKMDKEIVIFSLVWPFLKLNNRRGQNSYRYYVVRTLAFHSFPGKTPRNIPVKNDTYRKDANGRRNCSRDHILNCF